MIENIKQEELKELIGSKKVEIFNRICTYIEEQYDMETSWNNGGKKWLYEYKFRKSNKTLCAIYFKEDYLGCMIILGKEERAKVEQNKEKYPQEFIKLYDNTTTYHDGKWIMIELENLDMLETIKSLLLIKRKPNKK